MSKDIAALWEARDDRKTIISLPPPKPVPLDVLDEAYARAIEAHRKAAPAKLEAWTASKHFTNESLPAKQKACEHPTTSMVMGVRRCTVCGIACFRIGKR